MEFPHWMNQLTAKLGYTPVAGGVEEEHIKNTYYPHTTPENAAFKHTMSLLGAPKKEYVIRHF